MGAQATQLLHFHCLVATGNVGSAGSGGAPQGAELNWALVRVGQNVGRCPWRLWNVAVELGTFSSFQNGGLSQIRIAHVSHVAMRGVGPGDASNRPRLELGRGP